MKTKLTCLMIIAVLLVSIIFVDAQKEVIELKSKSDENSGSGFFAFLKNLFKAKENTEQSEQKIVLLDRKTETIVTTDNANIVQDNFVEIKETTSSKNSGTSKKTSRSSKSKNIPIGNDIKIVEESAETNADFTSKGINTKIIQFDTFPPPYLCSNINEIVDEVSLKLGTVQLDLWGADYVSCYISMQYDSPWAVKIKYCLIEDDPFFDDEIVCKEDYADTYDCSTLDLESYSEEEVKRKFENIDFSSYFYEFPSEGDTIEVYATISSPKGYFDEYSTPTYNIKEIDCECTSGECCDIATKKFKPAGSQPDGYTDGKYCSGTSSPTGTDYVKYKDYYCDGKSADFHTENSVVDSCGVCKYCSDISLTCKNYAETVSCGEDSKCDGSGNCIDMNGECSSDSDCPEDEWENPECYYGNVIATHIEYYCDYPGEKDSKCKNYKNEGSLKEECGTSDYEGDNYCYNDDVYRDYVNRGCSVGSCYANTEAKLQEDCGSYGCFEGSCKGPSGKICKDYDGGLDYYVRGNTCSYNAAGGVCYTDICKDSKILREFYCSLGEIKVFDYECKGNCETGVCIACQSESYSDCYTNDVYWFDSCDVRGKKKTECGKDENSSNYCYNNDVYTNLTKKGCFANACFATTTKQKVEECQYSCLTGSCKKDNCTNKCSAGEKRCDGNYSEICGYYDEDSCMDWPAAGNGSIYCKYGCENSICKKPDLTVADLAIQYQNANNVVLAFTIKNIGNAIAESVYWMIDSNSSDADPKRTKPISLGIGAWTRAFMKIVYAKSGNYGPKVIVDYDNLIEEANETNNEASIAISV